MRTKLTLAALAAASLFGIGAAQAQEFVVRIAPPAPVVETVPATRPGYVWAPGHYEWRHGQYVWERGHWIAERRGYEYREPRWVQRPNGEWFMVGGNWERRPGWARADGDHDGIPDRYDHDRNNNGIPNRLDPSDQWAYQRGPLGDFDHDGIRNKDDRDMDGDGVQNRYDRYPLDPTRH